MVALLVLCLAAGVPGSLDIDPTLDWYTLETDHFAVHFPCRGRLTDEARALPHEIAFLAEDIHAEITRLADWTPAPKTNVIVADFFDYANGWAAPLPDNTITLIPTPPAGNRTNYDDWLRTLIAHEYAHIIQMDMTRGIPAALRTVFGRLILTNPLLPLWALEGYALSYETRLTSFGRPRGTAYDMMIRAAADAGELLPIDRCNNYDLQRHPAGRAPYLYGGLFYRWLAEKNGPGIWDDYSRRYSGGFPYCYDYHARRTFGKDFSELWQDWQAHVTRRAESTARRLAAEPFTPLRQITSEGYYTGPPCWSRTGREVYYVSNTGRDYPAIRAVDTTGTQSRTLHRGLVSGRMSLSPDGRRLAFGERNVQSNYYFFSDIFALDLRSGELHRLTSGLRARDPDYSPDSTHLVFVANHDGRNDLLLLDLTTGETRNLTRTWDRTAYHSPRFSPRGRYIAVGIHRPGGYADIEILDRNTGWTIPVTEDRATDLSPCWDVTGRYLYFISDRSGVFNLYAYALKTGRTWRCTNVRYGVFDPALSPDNRHIALVTHTARGDDIAVTDVKARKWEPAEPFADTLPDARPAAAPCSTALYYYNPFPTILPKLWAPLVLYDGDWNFGAFTFGWDALQRHRYTVAAGYRSCGQNTPFLNIDYRLARFRPLIGLTTDLALDRQTMAADVDIPFHATHRTSWLGLGAALTRDSLLAARYSLNWITSNALRYRFGVAPATGAVIGVYSDLETRSMLGLRDRARVLAHVTHYSEPGPGTTGLRLRLAYGLGLGGPAADSAWRIHPGPGITGVRGISEESDPGRCIALAGLQLRTPLWWIERGIGAAPLFLRNINLALFADWGMTSAHPLPRTDDLAGSRLGVGAELRTDLILCHVLPVNLLAGCALGLRPEIDYQLYAGWESSLLDGLLSRHRDDRPRIPHLPD